MLPLRDELATNSAITWPMPVSVTVPTMMPAVAVAQAMPIMLREPRISPCVMSAKPRAGRGPRPRPSAACETAP